MLDTIELLDTIGQSAALRYASADMLASSLEKVNASKALQTAVLSGDNTPLDDELGQKRANIPHTQGFWGDED